MRIRNLPYEKLDEKEKKVVRLFHKECLDDVGQTCRECPEEQSVEGFWERHREADTENGEFDGWTDG